LQLHENAAEVLGKGIVDFAGSIVAILDDGGLAAFVGEAGEFDGEGSLVG
jgi:hypothetical protein